MAKIVIDQLPKNYNNQKPYVYADLHLDLQEKYTINDPMNQRPDINDFRLDYDLDAIKNSIRTLFLTSPGEKILDPLYGLDLRQFVFEPVLASRSFDLQRIIKAEINRYEPRVNVVAVDVIPVFDDNAYQINISIDVPGLGITGVIFSGMLNRNGYTFH